jgi:hypothetical protein
MITRIDALNDALDRLAGHHFVDGPGFACHGPMGAEALSALRFDDQVATWVDAYVATHPPIDPPAPTEPIDPDDDRSWRTALGEFSRVTDWSAMFGRQLRERPWQTVLEQWVPRLVSGYGGGLTHGLLRTAHAVRAMPAHGAPSGLMLGELATGLASWAGWYRALPGEPHLRGSLSLSRAIERIPRPREQWGPIEAGTFTRLGELSDFAGVVEALGPPEHPDDALSELSATFCRVLVEHPEAMPIGLVHTVTPIAAVRTLIEHVPAITTAAVYARVWQVNAAILAGFTRPVGGRVAAQSGPATDPAPDPAALAARAAQHGDAHVIKFTEACLREHARRPDTVYLHAADELLSRLSRAASNPAR